MPAIEIVGHLLELRLNMARVTSTEEKIWSGESAHAEHARPTSTWGHIWRFLKGPYPTLVSRLVLGVIFFLSGLTKLGVPSTFAATINAYEMGLPSVVVNVMAATLPVVELGLGVWMLAGLFIRLSAKLAAVLMAVFTIAIGQAWARGLEVDCGCFAGAGGNPLGLALVGMLGPVGVWLQNEQVGPEAIIRDLVFLAMALHLVFVPTIFSLDQLRHTSQAADDEEEAEDEAGDQEQTQTDSDRSLTPQH